MAVPISDGFVEINGPFSPEIKPAGGDQGGGAADKPRKRTTPQSGGDHGEKENWTRYAPMPKASARRLATQWVPPPIIMVPQMFVDFHYAPYHGPYWYGPSC